MLVRSERRRAPFSLFVAALAIASFSGSAAATEPVVTLGEVSGRTRSGEFTPSLRELLTAELSAASIPRSARDRFVLSVTLVELTAERKDDSAQATAVVSMSLRRARENTLYALLSGHATAEDSSTSVDSARDSALRAAVKSALRRLPEAVSRK